VLQRVPGLQAACSGLHLVYVAAADRGGRFCFAVPEVRHKPSDLRKKYTIRLL